MHFLMAIGYGLGKKCWNLEALFSGGWITAPVVRTPYYIIQRTCIHVYNNNTRINIIIVIIILLVLLAMFRQRTINYYPRTILMQEKRAVDVHWKAEKNSSILRRVWNVPIEVASRADELRLFPFVYAAKEKLSLWPQVRWRCAVVQQTVDMFRS